MTHINCHLIFCGGGSGGHVMPAISVINELQIKNPGIKIDYIGSVDGIESHLIPSEKIPYFPISSGKLRRYFSWKNFSDIYKIVKGIVQSILIIKKSHKNSLIISFGGFVSVPPVFAAWLLNRKILIHEQTTQVGLANKLNSNFAKTIMVSFEESLKHFPAKKVVYTGYPVRKNCLNQLIVKENIHKYIPNECGDRKVLFITGGGNGSKLINQLIYENLKFLRNEFFIIHQVGSDFVDAYRPYEDEYYKVYGFIGPEIIDLFKVADIVISRAGAGTVSELLALGKRSLFIPLKIAQKNEQFHNAIVAKNKLGSVILVEDDLNSETLLNGILFLQGESQDYNHNPVDGTTNILKELEKVM